MVRWEKDNIDQAAGECVPDDVYRTADIKDERSPKKADWGTR